MRVRLALVALSVLAAAGCGQTPPAPAEVVQNYVSAVAEGNFSSACGLLDGRARQSLSAAVGSNASCASLLVRCFPNQSTVLAKDQTQLLYGTVAVSVHGDRADAKTSGTLVANRIREVTLANGQAGWVLTSYGKERCPRQTLGRPRTKTRKP